MRAYEELEGRHLGGGAQADHRSCAAGEERLGTGIVGGRPARQVFTTGAGDCVTGEATGDDDGGDSEGESATITGGHS